MLSEAAKATELHHGITPRTVVIAAAALGCATLLGMALGAAPARTQGTQHVSLATVGHATPASSTDQDNLELQARQAAQRELAKAMLKKSLAEQAANLKAAAPAADVPNTTTGAVASASLASKSEAAPVATTRTAASLPAQIPAPPPQGQFVQIDPEDMQRLAGKAAEAIRSGDIASARLVLEHAMRAGDATAIYALAETYDPRVLVKLRVQGMEGEPDRARQLYLRALESGVEEARSRL